MLNYKQFQSNLTQLLPFKEPVTLAVAVSGGADSLALLLLCKEYSRLNGNRIISLTVDHMLRTESAVEADYVGKICKALNIEHHILKWQHTGINSNIQQQAREARYKLLTEYCNQHDILTLLTAHHADDKIENFFIRLSRGSGLIGLSEHNIHFINNIQILRPLYNFTKNDCYQILKQHNIGHIEDPSNSSDKYLRSEIRSKLNSFLDIKSLPQPLFKDRILNTMDNLNIAAKTIEHAFLNCLSESVVIYPQGFAILDLGEFQKFHQEEQTLVLSHILTLISGADKTPKFNSVKILFDKLISNSSTKITLHGCFIQTCNNQVLFYREFGKKSPVSVKLEEEILWDNRFLFKLKNKVQKDLYITPCSLDDLKDIDLENLSISQFLKRNLTLEETIRLPKQIIFTLPAIKSIEKLLAIPHINYYSPESEELKLEENLSYKFKPSFISRLTHYVF